MKQQLEIHENKLITLSGPLQLGPILLYSKNEVGSRFI